MSISAVGRMSQTWGSTKHKGKSASRAAFYGLLVDYWEIMLPVVALGPALVYFIPETLPTETKSTLTFLTFAAAFLGRPIGSVIFGHLADTIGRQRTTVTCSVGPGVPVLLVALLPGYESVGLWGLGGVLVLRLAGGIFMGGQYTSANPLAMEAADKPRRGIVGGFIASAWPVSYVAVSLLTALLVAVLPSGSATSAYSVWGWRIPFVLGAVLAFILFLYARKTAESQVWVASKGKAVPAKGARSPLAEHQPRRRVRPPNPPLRRAGIAEAEAAIAGFAVLNDVTMRDWQFRTVEWLQGKTFEGSTPIGPYLVTPDELPGGTRPALDLRCSVDGEIVQSANTGDLVFDPIALVAYVSTILTLQPGDVIATGTPGGVGHARNPKRYLTDGAVLVTEIEGLGAQRNMARVAAEVSA